MVLALAVQMASQRSWNLWPQNPALLANYSLHLYLVRRHGKKNLVDIST